MSRILVMKNIARTLLILTILIPALSCSERKKASLDTLVIGVNSGPKTLDPRYAVDAIGIRILNLMFHSFVKIGPDLKVSSDAADRWEWRDTTLHLWIPKGLRFHDGSEITKSDIEFTFEAFQVKDSPFRSALEEILVVKVLENENEFEVRLLFKKYIANFLISNLPIIRILPKAHFVKGKDFSKMPVGSGPYQLKEMSTKSILLTRSEAFPGEKPKIKNIEFKIVEDEYTLLAKLKKGTVHLVQNDLPKDSIEKLKTNKDLRVVTYPGLSFTYILVNWKDPLLQKKNLRKALAFSVDRDSIIKHKLSELALPATSLMSPSNPFFMPELKPTPYEPEMAKALIKELNLVGKEFSLKTSSQRSSVDNGFVLAKQMEASGLKVKLTSLEWGTYLSQLKSGNFQLATMRWVGAVDPDLYRIAFHSRELPPGRNRGSYQNPILDKLLDAGLSIRSFEDRKLHYFKVQKLVFEDLAVIPLWYDQQVAVIRSSVKNYEPVPNSDFSPVLKATLN